MYLNFAASTLADNATAPSGTAPGLQANHFGGLALVAPRVSAGASITSTPTVAGSDFQGTISIPATNVAVSMGTVATVVTLTFGTAYQNPPVCLAVQNGLTASIGLGHSTPSASGLVITASIPFTASPMIGFSIDYICSGI